MIVDTRKEGTVFTETRVASTSSIRIDLVTDMAVFSYRRSLILSNLLLSRVSGTPSWVVRGLALPSPADIETLKQVRARLRSVRGSIPDGQHPPDIAISLERDECVTVLAAIAPMLENDRLGEAECHALTGGDLVDAIELVAWLQTLVANRLHLD